MMRNVLGLGGPAVGDALTALGIGLAGYGSGNPNWAAPAILALGQRRQDRLENTRQAQQDEMTRRLFDFKVKAYEDAQKQDALKQQQFDALLPTLPPQLQATARAMGTGFLDEYNKHQLDSAYPKAPETPAFVDEYNFAVQQGFKGSIFDYKKQIAEAGRAPATPPAPKDPKIITLYGPDGKSVSMYDNDPKVREMLGSGYVAEAPKPSTSGSSLDNYSKVNSIAKPYIDSAMKLSKNKDNVLTSLDAQNGTGDMAAITSFNKMLDEDAVVRESDVALTRAAVSVAEQAATWVAQAKTGDIMPQELRDKIRNITQKYYDTGSRYAKARLDGIKKMATDNGVEWGQVITPELEQLFGWSLQNSLPSWGGSGGAGQAQNSADAIIQRALGQ